MAQDVLTIILTSAFDLLKGSFFVSIPIFFFAFFAFVAKERLQKRYKLNWIKSVAITNFLLCTCLVFVVYFLPLTQIGFVPQTTPIEFQDPIEQQAAFLIFVIMRLLFVSLIISFLVFPLIFIGSFIFDSISKKTKLPFSARLYLSVYVTTILTSYFLLFWAPFAVEGILYMIYFGLA